MLYPSVHHFADRGLRRLIEEEYARQAKDQRPELHAKLQTVLQQIDALEIPDLAVPARTQPGASNPAFELWAKRIWQPSAWPRHSSFTMPTADSKGDGSR